MHDPILIVDDDEDMREACARALARAGHKVEEAASGLAALERVRQAPPALLVVDLRLGAMDGVEVLEAARRGAPGLGAVIITGHPGYESALAAGRVGAAAYLAKPFTPEALVAACERALSAAAREARGAPTSGPDVPAPPRDGRAPEGEPSWSEARRVATEAFERDYIDGVLSRYVGNVAMAARAVGTNRRVLHRLMQRHGLRSGDYRR
ncbi:MAG: response regulator [Planctomycetes bacterium]|nr:response regulator [Planctomycetota bacterium]